MVTLNTQATPNTRTAGQDELHARLVKILDGGPCAIDERLAQLDQEYAVAAHPSMSSAIIAGGERILRQLFGARFAPRAAEVMDPLDVERERIALRALRGDFQNLPTVHQIEDRHALIRMEGEGGIVADDDQDLKHDHESAVCAVEAVLLVTGK